ncbi:hypothetical protein BV924_22615 [Pectobacterium odoriferum]|uniref:Uncharacterized protein n=1 Tax=Pectobacterium odoriferum TaxID=78398 RepID=A0ABD6VIH6_9GAMM|nr:hypothetical protein [Pectobacterium odoriferum]POD90700.1 hypothetical protein BVY06_22925 [Pectobacterium odoriferum]POE07832.1 hypothetical protein BV924_22615 [Pectobacterium odoriferum]POE21959.1 hypothetical protein BV926_22615 [Pectobacterium odoriferum]POE26541.1 hypothetical protein BV919_22640 [Pectobacterium odoriferum]POE36046.1 hypothetical protein BV920_22595 [Pectobacterium odoriferum]
MSVILEHIEALKNAKIFHIGEDYTYIGHTSGKLVGFEFVILQRENHSEYLHRYLLSVEQNSKIEKYFYHMDDRVPGLIGENIYFERRYLDDAPINEMLHLDSVL